MDDFHVPKKVNRHVLKAIHTLIDGNGNNSVDIGRILHQVHYQMRDLVPVPNLEMAVQKSLKNLSYFGLIQRKGAKRFSIGMTSIMPPLPPKADKPTKKRHLFQTTNTRSASKSHLNPNTRRAKYDSEDSLSGDKYDNSRKRLRTNRKKVNRAGRHIQLPKFRRHSAESIASRHSAPMNFMAWHSDKNFARNLNIHSNMSNFFERQSLGRAGHRNDGEYASLDQSLQTNFGFGTECNLKGNITSPELAELQPLKSIDTYEGNNLQLPLIEDDLNIVELYKSSKSFMNNSRPSSLHRLSPVSKKASTGSNVVIQQKSEISASSLK